MHIPFSGVEADAAAQAEAQAEAEAAFVAQQAV